MQGWWLCPLLAVACLAHAGDPDVRLDQQRSHAEFEVKVMWLIGVHGDFGNVHGDVVVNHFRDTATVDAYIDANDLHMRNRSYEAWTKSDEFFDSEHYPQIHFEADDLPLQRLQRGGEVKGTLTIRGHRRPVSFEIDPASCSDPLSGACAIEAHGNIRRSDFGMRSRRATLADRVQLRLTIFVAAEPAK